MEALDSDVYWQEVWKPVQEVVACVEQAVEARSAVHELERGLWERMLALGHGCLKLFFSLCGDGDESETWVLPEGRVRRRLPERPVRPYPSVCGPFELARGVYGTRAGQRIEAVPWDERLRPPESKFSYLLQEWTPSAVVQLPYAQVRALLSPLLPGLPAVHSLERIHHAQGPAMSRPSGTPRQRRRLRPPARSWCAARTAKGHRCGPPSPPPPWSGCRRSAALNRGTRRSLG
jgi:hypothetical protein